MTNSLEILDDEWKQHGDLLTIPRQPSEYSVSNIKAPSLRLRSKSFLMWHRKIATRFFLENLYYWKGSTVRRNVLHKSHYPYLLPHPSLWDFVTHQELQWQSSICQHQKETFVPRSELQSETLNPAGW